MHRSAAKRLRYDRRSPLAWVQVKLMSTRASYALAQERVCKQERMPRCASGERDCCVIARPPAPQTIEARSAFAAASGQPGKKLEACRFRYHPACQRPKG